MPRRSRSPSPRREDQYRRRGDHEESVRRREYDRRRPDEYERREDRHSRTDRDQRHPREPSRTEYRDSHRRRERSPSEDEPLLDLRKLGVSRIKDEDYFLKSGEFKYWLKDSRGRYLDELSSESAHKYFRKFARRWNDGALKEKYYHPPKGGSSSSQTGYKWSFASLSSDQPSTSRREPEEDEWQEKPAPPPPRPAEDQSSDDEIGPSLPSALRAAPTTADLQLAKEEEADRRRLERKAERREEYSRADEMVPRGVGKEGKMQEKRAANEENKKYREKDATEGFEADEGTLMGDSGSFAAALRARDGAAALRQLRKEASDADRAALSRERMTERKQRESETMEMFKALAKQRFG